MAITSPAAIPVRSEAGLLSRVAAGDPEAAVALYRAHAGDVFRFIAHRVDGPIEDIEEILQDTMIAAVTGAHRFRSECTVRTWLCGIARNQILQRRRTELRKKRIPASQTVALDESTLERLEESGGAGASDLVDQMAVREMVRGILDALEPPQRDLLVLRYVEDFSIREIASMVGKSERAVEGLIRRARQKAQEIGARYL